MLRMSNCDLLALYLERGHGPFSIESEMAFEKRLKDLHSALQAKQEDTSYHISYSLKFWMKRVKKELKSK